MDARIAPTVAAAALLLSCQAPAGTFWEDAIQAVAAAGTHLAFHEACHAATVSSTGGRVTGVSFAENGHLGYVSWTEGGNEAATAIAPYCFEIPLTSTLRQEVDKHEDSTYWRTWALLALLDLPVHLTLSYWQDDNDLNLFEEESGIAKEWMLGAAIVNTICYATDYDDVYVGFDEDSVSLGVKIEF